MNQGICKCHVPRGLVFLLPSGLVTFRAVPPIHFRYPRQLNYNVAIIGKLGDDNDADSHLKSKLVIIVAMILKKVALRLINKQ